MNRSRRLAAACVTALLASCAAGPREVPASWDGLERVQRPGLDVVYLRPEVDFSPYRRILLDPIEVSFDRNWDPRVGGRGLRTVDTQRIREGLARVARDVFRQELETEGGYQLVDEPAEDVLRVRAEIVDLYINAPEVRAASPVRTYVVDAGQMTLVAQLYDSQTNTLLARVVDEEQGREFTHLQIANEVTNTAEAREVIARWADMLRSALDSARRR